MPVRARNKVILGWLEGTVLSRWLHGKGHMLYYPRPAWTIDRWAFDKLRETHTVTKIIIHDQDASPGKQPTMYTIEIEEFDINARTITRGHYEQYMVPLGCWRQS